MSSTTGTVSNVGNVWTISSVPAGTNLTLTVTDGNTCQNTVSVTAPDCSCPVLSAPVSGGDKQYCSGSSVPAISASVSPGETVDWYSAPTGGSVLSTGTSYTPAGAGLYYAEARNTTTNCKSSTRTIVKVIQNQLPAATTGLDRGICYGLGTTIGAASVSGNTYSWTSSPLGFTSSVANPIVSPLVTTTYTLTETITATGCSDSHSVIVSVDPLPVVTAPAEVCVGTNSNLSPTIGGTWISSNPAVATVTNFGVITGISSGTATFTFTNSVTGCVSTTPTVDVNQKPAFTSSPSNITTNAVLNQCNAPVTYVAVANGVPTPVLSYSFT